MPAWDGLGTPLPPGFAALRMETNWLRCHAMDEQPQAGPGPEATRRIADPGQLLCRALQLAPACYRRFELAAARLGQPLEVSFELSCGGDKEASDGASATYASVAELTAAMQRFASAESVSVRLSSNEQTIIMHRCEQ